jgi:hypothetical protein
MSEHGEGFPQKEVSPEQFAMTCMQELYTFPKMNELYPLAMSVLKRVGRRLDTFLPAIDYSDGTQVVLRTVPGQFLEEIKRWNDRQVLFVPPEHDPLEYVSFASAKLASYTGVDHFYAAMKSERKVVTVLQGIERMENHRDIYSYAATVEEYLVPENLEEISEEHKKNRSSILRYEDVLLPVSSYHIEGDSQNPLVLHRKGANGVEHISVDDVLAGMYFPVIG